MQNSRAPTDVFKLAHLSDPHLTSPVLGRARDLFNKRLLGYGSWRRLKRHEHRPEILETLLNDLHSANPDHAVITGDLTHIGLPSEFQQVAEWLPKVGPCDDVTLVPGNHDTYVHHRWEDGLGLWSDYMRSDTTAKKGGSSGAFFPSLRVRGPLALIGLSSARPSAPLLAVGSLGAPQLERLRAILASSGARGLCRVLLIHHPPAPRSIIWRKRLTDAPALTRLLAQQGVELVLHGHSHRAQLTWMETPGGSAPAIGVRSASAIGLKPGKRAQYHLYRIAIAAEKRSLEVQVREYVPDRRVFDAVDRWSVELSAPKAGTMSQPTRSTNAQGPL